MLDAPASYQPIQTPARRLAATPTPMAGTPLYQMPSEDRSHLGYGALHSRRKQRYCLMFLQCLV